MALKTKFIRIFGEINENISQSIPYWLAGSITALVATTYAKLFFWAEGLSLEIYHRTGYWYLIIPPIFFYLSWFMVHRFANKANGSGIPQLMVAIELSGHSETNRTKIDAFLSLKIILVKICSSISSLFGGGAIGREGPTLQISGSIFNLVYRYWKLTPIRDQSSFLLAGAASGLASAFNTPLGGIVYAVEELAKSHLGNFKTGLLHSVIFAGILSQMIMGPYLYLGYPKITGFNLYNIPGYLIIAIFSGLSVVVFSFLLKSIVNFRGKLNSFRKKAAVAVGSGILFSVLALLHGPHTIGTGKEILNIMLFTDDPGTLGDLFARLGGTALTYANGGAGGIFAPTLSIGGIAGSFINHLIHLDLGHLGVLVGMTAGLAALTHSPLTSFILILEMTDRHTAIFPLMLASIIGHSVSRMAMRHSFYEFVCKKI